MGEETHSISEFWDQVDRAESCLVSSMYEEAASLSTSVLEGLCRNDAVEGPESLDIRESAGMVLVQSLHCLGRTSKIMNEIVRLFPTVAEIPVQVLLTGACLQISENFTLDVREVLEDFLSRWTCVDDRCYVLAGAKLDLDNERDYCQRKILGVDEYLEIAEVYVFTLLGVSMKDWGLAISWVEKASMSEELRQGLLRRLKSLCSAEATSMTSDCRSVAIKDHESSHTVSQEPKLCDQSPSLLKRDVSPDGDDKKQATFRLSSSNSCLTWFPSITLRLGSTRLLVTNAKVLFGCLVLLIWYILQRKRAAITGMVKRRAISVKQALVDFWRLAFSYQVNPLAAVQSLPVSNPGR